MMDNQNITIKINNYDSDNIIIFFEKNGKNIWKTFGLFNFRDEMDYWEMPTQLKEVNGNNGFVFSKDIDLELLKSEINRFIYDNKLNDNDFDI
ncbi:MAG TPA: hypothetical protein VIO64_09080 [Pseudobacteroides sp.]|uniref:hypothetical protein n=1 Tax=Pseudobacteroides sp. TaxID=1968840 RepID=UPI002F92A8CA